MNVPGRSRLALRSRHLVTLDQFASSGTNFAVGAWALIALDVEAFSLFGALVIPLNIGIGIMRSLTTDLHSEREAEALLARIARWRRAIGATGLILLVTAVLSTESGPDLPLLVTAALAVPALLVVAEWYRQALLRTAQPAVALRFDVTWGLVLGAFLLAGLSQPASGIFSVGGVLAAWASAAGLAVASSASTPTGKAAPTPPLSPGVGRSRRATSLVEHVMRAPALLLLFLVTASLISRPQLAALRAVQTAFALATTFHLAVSSPLLREYEDAYEAGKHRSLYWLAGSLIAVPTLTTGVALWAVESLPVIGDNPNLELAQALWLPATVYFLGSGLLLLPTFLLRAIRRENDLVLPRTIVLGATLIGAAISWRIGNIGPALFSAGASSLAVTVPLLIRAEPAKTAGNG